MSRFAKRLFNELGAVFLNLCPLCFGEIVDNLEGMG